MLRTLPGGRRLAAVLLVLGLLAASTTTVLAHARFDRAEPPAGSVLDGTPFVLTAYFTQELTSHSTLRVLDANGVQVDLGDGHVDLNDPDRKIMYVSLPALPKGVYTVEYVAESAEDGHAEPGTFMFGVGVAPPAAEAPAEMTPAEMAPAPEPAVEPAPAAAEPSAVMAPADTAAAPSPCAGS